jgi:hypothetical protein
MVGSVIAVAASLSLGGRAAGGDPELGGTVAVGLEDIFSWKEAQQKLTKTLNTDKHSNLNSQ